MGRVWEPGQPQLDGLNSRRGGPSTVERVRPQAPGASASNRRLIGFVSPISVESAGGFVLPISVGRRHGFVLRNLGRRLDGFVLRNHSGSPAGFVLPILAEGVALGLVGFVPPKLDDDPAAAFDRSRAGARPGLFAAGLVGENVILGLRSPGTACRLHAHSLIEGRADCQFLFVICSRDSVSEVLVLPPRFAKRSLFQFERLTRRQWAGLRSQGRR